MKKVLEKIWLRPTDVSVALNMSRSRVYQLIAQGVLPSVRIGKSVRVPVDALQKWIASVNRPK
jgi:excisionase family DNA binding protein